MKHSSAQLKKMARTALSGKWKTAALFTLLNTILTMLLSLCSLPFENSTTALSIAISWVISVIVSLISGLFSAGAAYFYLNISRGYEYKYTDLFYAFKADPDRFLIITMISSLPTMLCSLLSQLLPVPGVNASYEASAAYFAVSMILLYIGIIISWILSLFFALSHYLLLDYPEMGAIDSLRLSANLMKGNKGRYVYISLSFIGWILLSLFTLGIALFWIEPYMNMTITYFYADILNQLSVAQDHMDTSDNNTENDIHTEQIIKEETSAS